VSRSSPLLSPPASGRHVRRAASATSSSSTAGGVEASLKPLSLRWNFFWVAVGMGFQALSRWLMIVALAKLGHADMMGLLVAAFALCAPVYGLANLGLRVAVVTDSKGEYRFRDYLLLRLLTTALGFGAAAIVALGVGYPPGILLVILVVAVGKGFEALSDIYYGLLQQRERMDRIGISAFVHGVLGLALLALGVYLTGTLLCGAAGYAGAMAIALLVYDVPTVRRLLRAVPGDEAKAVRLDPARLPQPRLRRLWRLAWLTLPLGVVGLEVNLISNIPRYVVEHLMGTDTLGVFASVSYLASSGVLLVTAMGQSTGPRLAKYHAAGKHRAFWILTGKLVAVNCCLAIIPTLLMVWLGRPILTLVYDASFAAYADLAVWLMLAAGVYYLCAALGRALEATRRFTIHMAIRGVTIVLLLVLAVPLSRCYGLHGVAIAALLGGAASLPLYLAAIWAALRETAKGKWPGSREGRPEFADDPSIPMVS